MFMINDLVNQANAAGIKTQEAFLAFCEVSGVEATDYDDSVMLFVGQDQPVIRFDGTRWGVTSL